MKKIIKYLYMLIYHPYLFFYFTVKNGLFVKRHSDIHKIKRIKFGKNVSLGYNTRITFHQQNSEKKLFIGDNVYICNRTSFIVGDRITIGENVLIASDVCFISHNHGFDPELSIPYKNQELTYKQINVKEGTWIGEKAIILPGVTIGKKCIIGAGSVVTKNIPDYSIAVGNPAKVIKQYDFFTGKWEKIDV